MSRIWQITPGDRAGRPATVAPAGDTRLELTALPRGGRRLALVAAVALALVLLWRLYRREQRELSRPRRALAGRRCGCSCSLAVAVMLVEPVLVSTHRETVRSHLPIIVDDSESMRFADPYTDETRAAEVAAALQAPSRRAAKSPVDRLRETPRLDLVKAALGPQPGGAGPRPGRLPLRPGVGRADRHGRPGADADSSTRSSRTAAVSPLGDALRGVLAAHRGRPVAGVVLVTDGRSNAGEDPLRAAEAAARLEHPDLPDRRRGRGGAAERPARRDRGQPGRLRPRPDDAGRRRRGPRAARRRGDHHPRTARQRRRLGAGRQPAGRAGRGRHPQADDVPDRPQGGRPVRVPGPGRGRRAGADAGRQRRDRRGAGRPAADPRPDDRRRAVAGGPVPPQRAACATSTSSSPPGSSTPTPASARPGDRPITRLPNDAEELGRYDALLLVDPDMRALGPQWPEMITNFVGKDGGGLIFIPGELYSQQLFEADDRRVGRRASGRASCPSSASPACSGPRREVRLSTQIDLRPGTDPRGARRPDLRVPPRPDPQPGDPDEPAGHVLELPRHPRPARRDGPGPPRRPADAEPVRPARPARLAALRAGADGLHRLRQHLPLALPLGRLLRRLLGAADRPRRAGTRRWAAGSRSRCTWASRPTGSATR